MKYISSAILALLASGTLALAQPITGTPEVCTGSTTTLANSSPGGTWSSSNPSVGSIDGSGVVTGITAGTTTISYVTGMGTETAEVTVNPLPAALSGPAVVCSGSSVTLASESEGGSWSSSNASIATAGTAGVISGISSGTAVISYTLPTGCYTTATVSVDPLPATIGYSVNHVCEGSYIPLTNAVPGGIWTSGNTIYGIVDSATGLVWGVPQNSATASWPFTVYYEVCGIRDSVDLTLTSLVELFYPTILCEGETAFMTADNTGSEWRWTALLVGAATGTIDATTGEFTAGSAGIIRVGYARDSTPGCKDSTFSDNIYIVSPTGYITGNTGICEGDSTTLTVQAPYGTWSSSNTAIATVYPDNNKNLNCVVVGVSAGTAVITFHKSDTSSCYSTTVVTVNAAPDEITGTLSICTGGNTTLSSATEGGTWSSSNTEVATIGSESGTVTGVTTGTTLITYTAPTGCTTTATLTVTTPPAADPTWDSVVCVGGTLKLYANDEGGNTYLWTGPGSYTSTEQNPQRTSVTTAVNGTYTLQITTAAGCTTTGTLDVTIGAHSYAVSVNQTAPITITGETTQTYSGAGFTIQAVTTPALPATGVNYAWTGASSYSSSAGTFSPTFTTNSSVQLKIYTVTVTYNGCSAYIKDSIVVPATGCSPYTYFSVNGYRTASSMGTLAGCSDCSTIQPFHTIYNGMVTEYNVADNENYYIPKSVVCTKASLNNNVFFMAGGAFFNIDTVHAVNINHCHFFSSAACPWPGIYIIPGQSHLGQLRVTGNTLIENAVTTYNNASGAFWSAGITVAPISSEYYATGMPDILHTDSVFFNKNYDGIAIQHYKPSISDIPAGGRLPFTVKNCVFGSKELAYNDTGSTSAGNYPFAWPDVNTLKKVTSISSIPYYGINAYRNNTAITFVGHSGVYAKEVGSNQQTSAGDTSTPATYEYNYLNVGDDTADPDSVNTNLYDSVTFGIYLTNTNARLYNNTVRATKNAGVYSIYTYNDIIVSGTREANTNNRFYNSLEGIHVVGSGLQSIWDFTCINADFYGIRGVSGFVLPQNGCYLQLTGEHNKHEFSNNRVHNYNTGLIQQFTAGTTIARKGLSIFRNNTFVGKPTPESSDEMGTAVYVMDNFPSTTGLANGEMFIDSNSITGARVGADVYTKSQGVHINDNIINMYQYSTTATMYGITTSQSPTIKEVLRNQITGTGYNCFTPPYNAATVGIGMYNAGSAACTTNISCNLTADMKVGFFFRGASTVNWHHNEIRRTKWGAWLYDATIGQQGDACNPSDNRWTGAACTGSCSSCSDFPGWTAANIYALYPSGTTNVNSSPIYLRYDSLAADTSGYIPYSKLSYSYGTGSLIVSTSGACGGDVAEISECGPAAAERGMAAAPEHEETFTRTTGGMTLYPNPGNGNLNIELSNAPAEAVSIRVVNALGAEVYHALHSFEGNHTSVMLADAVPGMYLIQVTGNDGQVHTGRIVIVK